MKKYKVFKLHVHWVPVIADMLVKERRKRGKSPPILIHISISALIEDRPWYWVLELSLYLIGTINYDVDKCALLDARFLDILGADWLCKVTWYFVAHQSINLNSSSSILIMCVMLYLTKIKKKNHTHTSILLYLG